MIRIILFIVFIAIAVGGIGHYIYETRPRDEDEIPLSAYESLRKTVQHKSDVLNDPYFKLAIEDGKITNGEYREIQKLIDQVEKNFPKSYFFREIQGK